MFAVNAHRARCSLDRQDAAVLTDALSACKGIPPRKNRQPPCAEGDVMALRRHADGPRLKRPRAAVPKTLPNRRRSSLQGVAFLAGAHEPNVSQHRGFPNAPDRSQTFV